MAIDTIHKRTSSAGWYWPTDDVDRMSSIDEYNGIGAGAAAEIPGTPELRTLTIHRTDTHYTIGRSLAGYSTRRSGTKYTTRRR